MAFRNSVKATLLSLETEQQRSRSDEPSPLFEMHPPAPVAPPAPAAKRTPPAAVAENGEPSATSWRARGLKIRATTDTLPSEGTRPLMLRIAAIFDEFAREAELSEQDAPPSDDAPLEALPVVT